MLHSWQDSNPVANRLLSLHVAWVSHEWGLGGALCYLPSLQHWNASTLPPMPPGNPTRGILADCGGGGAAGSTREHYIPRKTAHQRSTNVPRRKLLRCREGQLEHAATLLGSLPLGQSYYAQGREELPTMRSPWDASQPTGYWSLENGELCNWHRTEGSTQISNLFGDHILLHL